MLHSSCKAIVVVSDLEQAKALKTTIRNILSTSNHNIEAELKGSLKLQYEIKYKVKTVFADGDIILTEKTAEKHIRVNKKNLCNTLLNILSCLNQDTEKDTVKHI